MRACLGNDSVFESRKIEHFQSSLTYSRTTTVLHDTGIFSTTFIPSISLSLNAFMFMFIF